MATVTNQHDLDLISQAQQLHFSQSDQVFQMADEAETIEGREELNNIAQSMYIRQDCYEDSLADSDYNDSDYE